MDHPNYFSVLPAEVRYDNDLCPNAKLLYSEITCLCNKNGYCESSNDYFANLYKTTKETVSRWISQLKKKKYIEVLFYKPNPEKNETKRILSIGSNPLLNIAKNYQNRQEVIADPLDEKINTPLDENVNGPHDKKVKHNNIKLNNSSNNIYNYYEKKFNKPITDFSKKFIDNWLTIYSADVIAHAIDIAEDNGKAKISYVNGILNNWNNAGFKTLDDIKHITKMNEIEQVMFEAGMSADEFMEAINLDFLEE